VNRLLSLAIAGFAAVLAVGLIFGALTAGVGLARVPYAVVILGVQTLFLLAFTVALRPPGMREVAVVGMIAAVAADVAAVVPPRASIAPLGIVAAGGFVAAVVAQLVRRDGRVRATESLGSSLVIVVGVVSLASLVVLTRLPSGTQAIIICLAAAGVALVVARVADTAWPWPRMAPQVPRGALGVVLGSMIGAVVAAVLGSYVRGFTPTSGALIGVATAVAAVLADLSVGYAEAGLRIAGELPTLWIARHMQGPLAGFALAAPLAYAMSVVFFVHRYT
jgi:hypothetical protein